MIDPDLIERIYECSFSPELWPSVLADLAVVAGARGGILFMANAKAGILNWTASDAIRDDVATFVEDGWIFRGSRLARAAREGSAGFVGDHDLFTEDELASDPAYRDFLRPRGLGWAAGTALTLPTSDVLVFSLERDFERGPADVEVIRSLDGLRPHLARSALMSARLRLERARTIAHALDLVGLPAVVLDGRRAILAVNGQAERLDGHVRWLAADTFAFNDGAADALLSQACAGLNDRSNRAIRSFAVRGGGDTVAMVAHVIPVRGVAADVFGHATGVLVMTPVTPAGAAPLELIQSLFDLTAAEAKVARALVAGSSIDGIATDFNVSRNTVRTHVRGVLEKTGCRRQAEVVALLSGLKSPHGA